MIRPLSACLLLLFVSSCVSACFAGGPLLVGGPAVGSRAAFGVDGQPFLWPPSKMPIQYRVDPGPMAATADGKTVIGNSAGVQRVEKMFAVWQNVSTAAVSFANAGALLSAGSYTGGDLNSVTQYNDVVGSCKAARQNPVIFDANGSLLAALGLPKEVIGFSSTCAVDETTGYITGDMLVMNGVFQDGVSTSSNYELSANQFDEAITHEIGHMLGLGHSQINVDLLQSRITTCPLDELAGLPLMFPVEFCQSRKDAGLPTLAPDDIAWISRLYPGATEPDNHGTISGYIFFGEGTSQVQGVNVIARALDDPNTPEDESRRVAVSVVSGYLFTGNTGQSVTAKLGLAQEDNTYGNSDGSRNPQLIGYYEISVPPGTYTVEAESVYASFVGGSSVGPLDPPVPLPGGAQLEFWSENKSAFDYPQQRDPIVVHAGGKLTNIDIILNDRYPHFDQFEDSGSLRSAPLGTSFWTVESACA